MVLKTSREQWFTIAEKRYEDTNSQARQQQGSFRSTKHEQVIALEPREKKIFLTDFSKKKSTAISALVLRKSSIINHP